LYNLVLVWETTITSLMSRVYKYILQVTVIDMPMYVHIQEFNVYTWQQIRVLLIHATIISRSE
jgi:hypothetical protein